MRRRLGAFESALTLTDEHGPFNVCMVFRLTETPPSAEVERRLARCQARHPLLGVRLLGTGGRYFFESGAPAVPVRYVERTSADQWTAVAESEIQTPIPRAIGPLLRVVLLQAAGGGSGELVFTFHHAIMDAVSALEICREVLGFAAEEPSAPGQPAANRQLPSPQDRLYPAPNRGIRGGLRKVSYLAREVAGEASFRWRSRGGRVAPVQSGGRARVMCFELSENSTRRLVRRSRRERSTLNGVSQAAMLLALSKHLYGGRAQPLRSFTFPDLRPYLRPPAAAEPLACYISMMRFAVEVDGQSDVWEIARRVNASFGTAARRGDKFTAPLLSPTMMGALLRFRFARMGAGAVSYTGVVRVESPNVTGVHAFVSNVDVGPEYSASVRLFSGRLCWDVVYLDSDMDRALAETVAEEICGILERAGLERAGEER